MNTELTSVRRDVLVEQIAIRLRGVHLREPAIFFLSMHLPLAYLGSQLLLVSQPLLGALTGDALARDLALFCAEPTNIERLIARLAESA